MALCAEIKQSPPTGQTAGKTYRLMGTSSPDRPFEFLRFLTEEEASAGQLNLAPSGSFQFFVLEVE